MKDRKTMAHNALVAQVIRQLASRFQPNLATVKKRIESLLDRGTSFPLPLALSSCLVLH